MAEDNEINTLLVRSMLDKLGLTAEYVSNGIEAISRVQEARQIGKPFNLILMDIHMPLMDGLEATKQLRQQGFSSQELPIVALTANCFAEDLEACKASGMQDHVSKPIALNQLESAIAQQLKGGQQATELSLESISPDLQQMYDEQKARACELLRSLDQDANEGGLVQSPHDAVISVHLLVSVLCDQVLAQFTAAACSALARLSFSFLANTVTRKIGILVPPNA